MRRSFKVHAGLQLALAVMALSAAAYSAVPYLPPAAGEGIPQDQRTMFGIYGLIAAGGGAVTLVFAKLDDWAHRP